MRTKVAQSNAERMRRSREKWSPVRASLGVFVRKSLVDESRARVAGIRSTARDALKSGVAMSTKDRAVLEALSHAGLMHLVGAALELLARQTPDKQAELIGRYIAVTAKAEATMLNAAVEQDAPTDHADSPALDALGEFIAPIDGGVA